MRIGIGCILLLLILASCKEDPLEQTTITPYELDVPSHFPPMPIPADNPMSVEGVELGKHLFYDERLSRDNSISCASCHSPQNSFSDSDQFSEGVDGLLGDRQSMALINLGWQSNFFWDGRAGSIEEQIFEPVVTHNEMDQSWEETIQKLKAVPAYQSYFTLVFGVQEFDSTHVSKAIAQFLRTLISAQSKYDVMYKYRNGLALTTEEQNLYSQITTQEWGGYDLFFSLSNGDCLHCHNGPLAKVAGKFSNNGLDATFADEGRKIVTGDANDAGKFKIPTLRNIELSAPYMHDGRFNTLDEVVNHYSFGVTESSTIDPLMEFSSQGGVQLDAQEHQLLVKFLKTFTDESFINNPDFQDPGDF